MVVRMPMATLALPSENGSSTRAYQVWLLPDQITAVQNAHSMFGREWSDWSALAIERLAREDALELKGLLSGQRRTSKVGKERLSFRLRDDTFKTCQAIAKTYSTSIQAVIATAFGMQALALDQAVAVGEVRDVHRLW